MIDDGLLRIDCGAEALATNILTTQSTNITKAKDNESDLQSPGAKYEWHCTRALGQNSSPCTVQEPEIQFNIALTLKQNAPLEALQSSGLIIEKLIHTAMIVTGKANLQTMLILLEMSEVELLEENGGSVEAMSTLTS